MLDFYITQEIEKQDFSKEPIETLSIDEIARKKHPMQQSSSNVGTKE